MKTIDCRGQEGNVFVILGIAQSFQKQMAKVGGKNEHIDKVLAGYTEMDYAEILNELEKSGLFKFKNRK